MNLSGEGIVCHPSELMKEAHGRSLAFHPIKVEVIQDPECKSCFGPTVAGWKYLVLKELHRVQEVLCICTMTPDAETPLGCQSLQSHQMACCHHLLGTYNRHAPHVRHNPVQIMMS